MTTTLHNYMTAQVTSHLLSADQLTSLSTPGSIIATQYVPGDAMVVEVIFVGAIAWDADATPTLLLNFGTESNPDLLMDDSDVAQGTTTVRFSGSTILAPLGVGGGSEAEVPLHLTVGTTGAATPSGVAALALHTWYMRP